MRIRDLLNKESIDLNLEVGDKEVTINRLVELAKKSGCLSDAPRFNLAVLARERKGTTALGEGVAIPHAKSAGVKKPGLAAAVIKDGIDFDSLDGKKTYLFFLIASPHQASNEHLDVLAHLSSLLIDDTFRKNLINATSVDEFLKYIDDAESNSFDQSLNIIDDVDNNVDENKVNSQEQINTIQDFSHADGSTACKVYDLVAVTACPAGLSHTYMAAEALEHKAKELGLSIKVETDGAAGNKNKLLPEEIAKAKAVIVAADRTVYMDRFVGKKVVRTGVVDGIRNPELLIKRALDSSCKVYQSSMIITQSSLSSKIYRHLMSGLAYILPLIATAGILLSLASNHMLYGSKTGLFFSSIGINIGSLINPAFAAFIAFSMAGRTGLVAGFTGGVVASISGAGILGSLFNGYSAGLIAFLVSKLLIRLVKGHDALLALLFYPLVSSIATACVGKFLINPTCTIIDSSIYVFVISAPEYQLALVGAILAGIMAADMGGPINKVAYACGVLMLADTLPNLGVSASVMGAVMLGGMVPPIAAGLASILYKNGFSKSERKQQYMSIIKGLCFITEAVIPYLKANSILMRFACIAGASVGGALCMYFRAAIFAPHGGIFVVPLSNSPIYYILSLGIGVLVSTVLFILLRIILIRSGMLKDYLES